LFAGEMRPSRRADEALDALMQFGPFPEPLLAQDARKARLWRRERVDAVVREDLRDLSRIVELDRVQLLAALLPERAGSLLSVDSLRRDIEVSHETVQRWLSVLDDLYYCYHVHPFTSRIRRSIRKAGKLYLWDFGEVSDAASRFENLVASHLLKACHYWSDTGYGDFELRCLRNRDNKELDFVVTRDARAWLPVEVKRSDRQPSRSWRTFLPSLRCDHALQLVLTPGVREEHDADGVRLLVVSAADALRSLV
jgi:predicted AAA+ superfamily ATPase